MDDEKPFDLRDRIALEILNGIISNPVDINRSTISDLIHYITYTNDCDDMSAKKQQEYAAKSFEKLIRGCYKVADIVRKVRLSTFE